MSQPVASAMTSRRRSGPHTRPDRVLADKAYASRANRAYLRRCRIKDTIPIMADQAANRRRRGSRGGREYVFDRERYKQRQAVEATIQVAAINGWL